MRYRYFLARAGLAALILVAFAGIVAAQGRFQGEVKDDKGAPVPGASVQVASLGTGLSQETKSDKNGRFGIVGLRFGDWTYVIMAPGYEMATGRFRTTEAGKGGVLTVTIRKGGPKAVIGATSKELQDQISKADAMFNAKQYDDAIAAYNAILEKVPALFVINLQVAQAYRGKKEYDNALAAYSAVLKSDPTNDRAKIGMGQTNLEKGDFKAAEETLAEAAQSPTASKEDFYNYGELKFAAGETDAAQTWYQKAADTDPTWGRPVFKLGLVALNKGDTAGAAQWLDKVIAMDPSSPEAAQAKAILSQLK